MYKTSGIRNSRIEVADALRGIAVMGIILYHSVEHFNMFARSYTYTLPCDKGLFNALNLLLSGKMYGIFALLFGLSFFIMRDNQEQKGKDFSGRFAWRMVLLFLFGMVNLLFYDGDILVSYAIFGLLMIPAGYLPNRVLWPITIILLLQPLDFYTFITGKPVMDAALVWKYYGLVGDAHTGSFLTSALADLKYGIQTNMAWNVYAGRITQIPGMFFLGILLGRRRLFYNEGNNLKIWRIVLAVSAVLGIAGTVIDLGAAGKWLDPIVGFSLMLVWVSGVVLLWYAFEGFRKALSQICFFGRMSLTNYLLQSVIGSFLFYGFGLGLYNVLGTTYAFLVGIAMVLFQLGILRLWARNHERGPLESLWRKLTWLDFSK